jgi:hypothetical protein
MRCTHVPAPIRHHRRNVLVSLPKVVAAVRSFIAVEYSVPKFSASKARSTAPMPPSPIVITQTIPSLVPFALITGFVAGYPNLLAAPL